MVMARSVIADGRSGERLAMLTLESHGPSHSSKHHQVQGQKDVRHVWAGWGSAHTIKNPWCQIGGMEG